jgi:hypothetical protein
VAVETLAKLLPHLDVHHSNPFAFRALPALDPEMINEVLKFWRL